MIICGRVIVVFILCFLAIGAECAAQQEAMKDDSEAYFYDRYGDLMLIGRGMDIYIEMIDGSDSRKITSTLDLPELDAFFGLGGRYVLYKVEKKTSVFDKTHDYQNEYFMQKTDDTDITKVKIGELVYRDLKMERIREKNATINK